MRTIQSLKLAVVAFVLICGISRAASIQIDLTSPLVAGTPGSQITFNGTLMNTTLDTLFLNSAGVNLAGAFDASDLDVTPFLINAPLTLAAGDSMSAIDMFTITIPIGLAPGSYGGEFTVLGGADGSAQDILGTVDFTVEVQSGTAIPEPSTWLLCLGGLMAIARARSAWKRSQ